MDGFLENVCRRPGDILSFQSKDTVNEIPCAVMSVPVKNVLQAERRLQSLLYTSRRKWMRLLFRRHTLIIIFIQRRKDIVIIYCLVIPC